MPLKSPTTTPLPDEIYDEWAPLLGHAELKVLLYIVRRTLGFRKATDPISLNQFAQGIVARDGRVLDHGCGIASRPNVVRALHGLEQKGLIRVVKARSQAGDRDISTYALRWDDDEAPGGGGVGTTPPGVAATPPWCRSDREVVSKENHGGVKTTPTTNSLPTNRQQHSGTNARASTPPDDSLWSAVLDDLRGALTPENFAQWLAPTSEACRTPTVLTVRVPSCLHQQWLDTKLRWQVERALRTLQQPDLQIVFEVAS